MAWEQLDLEIGAMFAEHSWRSAELDMAMEKWSANVAVKRAENRSDPWRRKQAVLYTKRWREKNIERDRKNKREADRRRRERAKTDPVFGAKYRAIKRASDERRRAVTNANERRRDYFRERQRAKRREKSAALGIAVAARHCSGCGSADHNVVYCARRAA